MNNFNMNFSFADLFDALYYLNKMAKVLPAEKRIINNSLFYKIKSAIVYNLIKYADAFGLTIKIISRDMQYVGRTCYWIAFEILKGDAHLKIHSEENYELRELLDELYPDWDYNLTQYEYVRTDDFPEFDEEKYKNSYNVIMSAMRKMGIFVEMYNSHTYPYEVATNYISYFYPEIQFVINKKLTGSKAHDGQILADVFINGKKFYTQKRLHAICGYCFEKMISEVERQNILKNF